MSIDFASDLNLAQLEAVLAPDGPSLVIAGAGSGKTRTIVYRLAHLVQRGVAPESILLLTFTRKASQEMLTRAGTVLGRGLTGVHGGTFHSYAYAVLRRHAGLLGFQNGFTVLDQGDCEEILAQVKSNLSIGKSDRSFPKRSTILGLISKSRNKERDLEDVLQDESFHLLPYLDDLGKLAKGYGEYKLRHGLMDYDDLLFGLERLLTGHEDVRTLFHRHVRQVLVDEYQDTNLVQARLVKLLAGEAGNVMAVGDDAQSIYAFRGASVKNILTFPETYPGAKIIRLEQNYRSTQPILDLTNRILAGAKEHYDKNLFTLRTGGDKPELLRPLSDMTQAQIVARKVNDLSRTYQLHDIAVLFRAGYQSYPLEVLLNKMGIPFQKYGGLRFSEAAHIKDVLAILRLVLNPADMPAWMRTLSHIKGIGPATSTRLFESVMSGDAPRVAQACKKKPELKALLDFLGELRALNAGPAALLERIMAYYQPILVATYPDDYPRRQAGLEQLGQIASAYKDLDSFLADLSLEVPEEPNRKDREGKLVLTTVHSAKGLEWSAVIVIDLVQDRFPSKHALFREDDLEEERRLLYVACTRARESLCLSVPATLYNRYQDRSEPAVPSPFIRELDTSVYDEWQENYAGGLVQPGSGPARRPGSPEQAAPDPTDQRVRFVSEPLCPVSDPMPPSVKPERLGYCTHKIFGRGKIVAEVPPNKYRVNFPGFGLKVIIADYLVLE